MPWANSRPDRPRLAANTAALAMETPARTRMWTPSTCSRPSRQPRVQMTSPRRPGISSQHIGTGAQNGRLQLPSMGPAEKAGQLLHTAGEGHHLTGTADPKGSMLGQRLLHPQLRLREGRLNCLL